MLGAMGCRGKGRRSHPYEGRRPSPDRGAGTPRGGWEPSGFDPLPGRGITGPSHLGPGRGTIRPKLGVDAESRSLHSAAWANLRARRRQSALHHDTERVQPSGPVLTSQRTSAARAALSHTSQQSTRVLTSSTYRTADQAHRSRQSERILPDPACLRERRTADMRRRSGDRNDELLHLRPLIRVRCPPQ